MAIRVTRRVELGLEVGLGLSERPRQPIDLGRLLAQAVRAGRRRGFGRRGRCVACGRALASHLGSRNRQLSCE